MSAPATTNYEKFQTTNPLVRRLIGRFYAAVGAEVRRVAPGSLLDAGCGEGETLARLGALVPPLAAGVDLNPESVAFAAARLPAVELSVADITALPFEDSSFELVLCLEVLEHLPRPGRAVAELARVSAGALIVSVPHEPWFRLGSLSRGKHLTALGNHPEHVQRFGFASLRRLLEPEVEVVSLEGSFPWLLASCRTRCRAR